MNLFNLAELQLQREKIKINNPKYKLFMLDRAIKIRKYIDIQQRNTKVAINRYKKLALV